MKSLPHFWRDIALEMDPDRLMDQYSPEQWEWLKNNDPESLWRKSWDDLFDRYAKMIHSESSIEKKLTTIEHLGEVYQFYITHILEFSSNKFNIKNKSQDQKTMGIVYTPKEITQFIIKWLNVRLLRGNNSLDADFSVADIACGTGLFLFEWLKQNPNLFSKNIPQIFGFDKDGAAISIGQLLNEKVLKLDVADSLFNPSLNRMEQFNVIVGNPPYVKSSAINDQYWENLRKEYQSAFNKFDLSVIFLEKIIHLLKPDGYAGIIISNKWMTSRYGKRIREMLLNQTWIRTIVDVSNLPIFRGVSTYPVILIFQKKAQNPKVQTPENIELFHTNSIQDFSKMISGENKPIIIKQDLFRCSPNQIFITDLQENEIELLYHFWHLKQSSFFHLCSPKSPFLLKKGIHTGNVKSKLVFDQIPEGEIDNPHFKPMVSSRQKVEQYKISWQGLWIKYDPVLINKKEGDYGSLREQWLFEAEPKIIIKLFGIHLQAAIDFFRYYANNSLIMLIKKDQNPSFSPQKIKIAKISAAFHNLEEEFYYLLGILNSSLISQYYRVMFKHTHVRGNYIQFYIKDLSNIPIIIPNKYNFRIAQEIAKLAKDLTELHQETLKNESKLRELQKILNKKVEVLYDYTKPDIE